jgi:predicted Zn-dependent protease
MKQRQGTWIGASVALVAMVWLVSCAISVNPLTGKRGLYGYSWQQEISLGREADASIQQEYGIYGDSMLVRYVRGVGEGVLAKSHLRRADALPEYKATRFTFRVLDSPIVNAFALPGGYVYVTRGLLSYLENEAQLSVVMAHEIGHVAARHGSRQAAKSTWSQLGILGGAVLAENVLGAGSGQTVMDLGSQAASLLLLKYSRSDESEADRLGVEYAAMAGYKAGDASRFFRSLARMSDAQGGRLPTFMSTHPDPGQRETTVTRLAAEWAARGYAMDKIGGEVFFGQIDGMILGENPRSGYADGGTFYHPDLRFQFPIPTGWRTVNDPAQVVLVSPDQKANVQITVVPGVNTASAGATKFLSQEGVNTTSNSATQVNNMTARDVRASVTQSGTELAIVAYFVEYGGRVYALVGYTPKTMIGTYEGNFLSTMRGFNRLTNATILAVKPFRVKTVVADRNAAFSSYLTSTLPTPYTPNDIAIINQVNLTDVVQRGMGLKLWQR